MRQLLVFSLWVFNLLCLGQVRIKDLPSADPSQITTQTVIPLDDPTYGVRKMTLDDAIVLTIETSQKSTDRINTLIRNAAPLSVTSTGLTVSVGAGQLTDARGSVFTFAGGSVPVPASVTGFITLDLHGTLHFLRRAIHGGHIVLASVTSTASAVTITEVKDKQLPKSGVERTKRKLELGQPVRVALIGDSLFEAFGSPTWYQQLFVSTWVASGRNVQGVANVTLNNYGLGSVNSKYGEMLVGRGFLGPGSTTLDLFATGHSRRSYYADFGNFQYTANEGPTIDSPVIGQQPDLLIVGFYNSSIDKLISIENIVRRSVSKGIEVILVASGPNASDPTFLSSEGDTLLAITSKYGASLADVNSFMREQVDRGNNPYVDGVHQSQVGADAWAQCIRSVLSNWECGELPVKLNGRPVVNRLQIGGETGRLPTVAETCFVPQRISTSPAGTYNNAFLSGSRALTLNTSPSKLFGGRADNNGITLIPAGGHFVIGHPLMLGFDLLLEVEGGKSYTYRITRNNNGTVVRNDATVSWPAGATPQVQLYESGLFNELFSFANSGHVGIPTPVVNNHSFRVDNTHATEALRVAGYVVHTVDYDEVPFGDWHTRGGTFAIEAGFYTAAALYTDDVGASASLTFTGRGLYVSLHQSTKGGQLAINVNGTSYATPDFYSAGSTPAAMLIVPDYASSGNSLLTEPRQHTVTIRLTGVNGSAVSTVAGERRLQIAAAYVIK